MNIINAFLLENEEAVYSDQIQPAFTVIITDNNYKDKLLLPCVKPNFNQVINLLSAFLTNHFP